jgi:hypothetical protein
MDNAATKLDLQEDALDWSYPKERQRRIIINTDAKNEADDQFAIVHALLTPSFDVRATST